VRCPRCGTTYRRPARVRPGTQTAFRCARCRHVFDVTVEEPAVWSADDAETEVEDDEPAFLLGDEEEGDKEESEPDPEPPKPRERVKPAARAVDKAPPPGPSAARFAVRALLFITFGYALLSIYLYTHPEQVQLAFGSVPFLASRLVESHVNPASIQLADVRGEYQRVKGDHLVFVISGAVINNAPIPVRRIQVEGHIVGAREERQAVFSGAARREVQDLSLREITLLQSLEPPREWMLAPGDQATFVVVFADPPTDLREFAAEVVAVQAPTRRSTGGTPAAENS
jgi:hypothetical protein